MTFIVAPPPKKKDTSVERTGLRTLTVIDKENKLFFVCSELVELVKLETSHTVIIPPTVSVV